jgi:hypothetical protein
LITEVARRLRDEMQLYVAGSRPAALPEHGESLTARSKSWWETPYGRWRLTAEKEAMSRFPGFELADALLEVSGRMLGWRGRLESSLEDGDRYGVRVIYPADFPDQPPVVFITEPALPDGMPHLLDGNRPCLYRPMDGPRNGYDPARTTAATLVAWTVLWINAFETWRATGEWPGSSA